LQLLIGNEALSGVSDTDIPRGGADTIRP